MTETFHVVWSYGLLGPRLQPVTTPVPREKAVKLVLQCWAKGHMARLEPPLIARAT